MKKALLVGKREIVQSSARSLQIMAFEDPCGQERCTLKKMWHLAVHYSCRHSNAGILIERIIEVPGEAACVVATMANSPARHAAK